MPRPFSYIAFVLLLVSAGNVFAEPLIILDAGHEPSKPGALATCGKPEVAYNDEVTAILANELSDYRVLLTRRAQTEVLADANGLAAYVSGEAKAKWAKHKTLLARAALANQSHADVFIAIHHDSTAERWQISDPALCGGKGGKGLAVAFKQKYRIGFNIFVNDNGVGACRSLSLKLARLIGQRLLALGRVASDYHLDDCKSCRSIDPRLGVWHQDLAVLRETSMPAVLIEVGNIIDPDDEAVVGTAQFRRQFAQLIKAALDEYFAADKLGKRAKENAYSACFFW